jgi:hypothetical protein
LLMLSGCLVTSTCVDFTHLGHLRVPYRVQSRTIYGVCDHERTLHTFRLLSLRS